MPSASFPLFKEIRCTVFFGKGAVISAAPTRESACRYEPQNKGRTPDRWPSCLRTRRSDATAESGRQVQNDSIDGTRTRETFCPLSFVSGFFPPFRFRATTCKPTLPQAVANHPQAALGRQKKKWWQTKEAAYGRPPPFFFRRANQARESPRGSTKKKGRSGYKKNRFRHCEEEKRAKKSAQQTKK